MIVQSLSEEFLQALLKEIARLGLGPTPGETAMYGFDILQFERLPITNSKDLTIEDVMKAQLQQVSANFKLLDTTSNMLSAVYKDVISFPITLVGMPVAVEQENQVEEVPKQAEVFKFIAPEEKTPSISNIASESPPRKDNVFSLKPTTSP